ncbi:uncharacterized protein DUF2852 [Rhodobacter aestuarii]|uniref:DUF2852 domain-containing protein n=1 Tax=Rhodobacter aestuarii TaxID=453582 RepID=A0A1N7M0X6_9RHOB|nr:DUF2852 domain-containing protein [Rhodobacter aestuarii]PTV94768.1 uncharacterized protein DUF2852 [Rhodobacter aestuarii]SIS79717.1 Protein of unknown function [Rhodobacter aestuarii]
MTATTFHAHERPGVVTRALNWLDERGPMSWVIVMIGSFIFAGPLGLLVLGFILITGRFSGRKCRSLHAGCPSRYDLRMHFKAARPTGNAAFDAYKADTLARLEREQDEFEAFLHRLREARDKAEFDQYMEERARAAAAETASAEGDATEAPRGQY